MNEYVSVLNLSIKPVLAAQVCCKYWGWWMNSNLFEASFKIGAPTEGLIQCQDDLYHHSSEPAILRGQLVRKRQKIDTTSVSPTWHDVHVCVWSLPLHWRQVYNPAQDGDKHLPNEYNFRTLLLRVNWNVISARELQQMWFEDFKIDKSFDALSNLARNSVVS